MYTLGLNVGHNGSTTLLKNGRIVFHIEEERLTRVKRDSEPLATLLKIKEFTNRIDTLVISGTQELPRTHWTGIDYYTSLLSKSGVFVSKTIIATNTHHLAHASNSFYNSDFDEALVVVIDGAGSLISLGEQKLPAHEAETIFKYSYESFEVLFQGMITSENIEYEDESLKVSNNSTIVKVYEAFTNHLGWHPIEAGKLMGLASYGKFDSKIPNIFDGDRGVKKYFKSEFPALSTLTEEFGFGVSRTEKYSTEFTQTEKNLARKVQFATEVACENLVRKALKMDPSCKNVCISGGYGLNVVNNYKLTKKFPDVKFYFEPTCNDAGNSIGVVKQAYYEETKDTSVRGIDNFYLGFEYNFMTTEIPNWCRTFKVTPTDIATLLSENNIVAIYQGRSEAGPRALGNRSFMYNPIEQDSRDKMNKVKHREWFRPFAASVLKEEATNYFDMTVEDSPYMMMTFPTKEEMKDKIAGVVHVDGTTRIQTVTKKDNFHYRKVIEEFYKITGVPMIMNTSFNLAGEPLVETPQDALDTLLKADFKYLYIPEESLLIQKGE